MPLCKILTGSQLIGWARTSTGVTKALTLLKWQTWTVASARCSFTLVFISCRSQEPSPSTLSRAASTGLTGETNLTLADLLWMDPTLKLSSKRIWDGQTPLLLLMTQRSCFSGMPEKTSLQLPISTGVTSERLSHEVPLQQQDFTTSLPSLYLKTMCIGATGRPSL